MPVGSGRFRDRSQDSYLGPGNILFVFLFAQVGASPRLLFLQK